MLHRSTQKNQIPNNVRWGMIGTGMIAKSFAKDFVFVEEGELAGVAGRDPNKTAQFAEEFTIRKSFPSAHEMLQSSELDAVYIATPHPSHFELAVQSLECGKHVLIEKPITVNAAQAQKIFDLAARKNLFAAEAMWTRFLPFARKLRELIQKEKIGRVQTVQSSMGYPFPNQKPERLFKKELGGGALLDMGVYSLAFSQMLLQSTPSEVLSTLVCGPTEVDHKSTWILNYESGAQAIGASSIDSLLAHEAVISGTRGQIRIPEFWRAKGFFCKDDFVSCDYEGMGLHFQVTAANKSIQNGHLETVEMPWADSLITMKTVDRIFRNSGF